jgi:drug/metabolite transporter (DMT)-like permease
MMDGFSAAEVAIIRYFFFGVVSSILLIKKWRFPWPVWKRALIYALIYGVGYYPCLVLGLRYATPAISALVLGLGPIGIAFYGNWREKECSFRSLIVPSILVFLGLVLINAPALSQSEIPTTYLLGLLACFCALTTWVWSVVAYAHFLRKTPEISSGDWSTLNGVTTLIWVVLYVVLFSRESLEFARYTPSFLLGGAILGMVCSWVGSFLWNRATLHLPVSFAGQITIFETIFGLVFIYALERKFPPIFEWAGIILFLIAIFYSIRKFSLGSVQTLKD